MPKEHEALPKARVENHIRSSLFDIRYSWLFQVIHSDISERHKNRTTKTSKASKTRMRTSIGVRGRRDGFLHPMQG